MVKKLSDFDGSWTVSDLQMPKYDAFSPAFIPRCGSVSGVKLHHHMVKRTDLYVQQRGSWMKFQSKYVIVLMSGLRLHLTGRFVKSDL